MKPTLLAAALAALLIFVPSGKARTIEFSGYQWDVRPTEQSDGPGLNHWDENNASVDSNGYLHLKLTQ